MDGGMATVRAESPPAVECADDACAAPGAAALFSAGPDARLVMEAVGRELRANGPAWLEPTMEAAMDESFQRLTPHERHHGRSAVAGIRERKAGNADGDGPVRVYESTPAGTWQHVRLPPSGHNCLACSALSE